MNLQFKTVRFLREVYSSHSISLRFEHMFFVANTGHIYIYDPKMNSFSGWATEVCNLKTVQVLYGLRWVLLDRRFSNDFQTTQAKNIDLLVTLVSIWGVT